MEFARSERFNFAVEELLKVFRARRGELRKPLRGNELSEWNKRTVSLALLHHLMTHFDRLTSLPIGEFYNGIHEFLTQNYGLMMTKTLQRGQFKPYVDQFTYSQLAPEINLSGNEVREIRTIHQAKGAEFTAVLMCLNHEDELLSLMDGDVENPASDDELRVRYVGLSRARDYLFISVPELSQQARQRLEAVKVHVRNVDVP
ncbi:MAG: 3'-5' exonuclease [Bacilli bacterium]